MWAAIKRNPVRLYTVIVAALPLVQHYYSALPVELVVALSAAIFGIGEGVRSVVTPTNSPQTSLAVPLVPATAKLNEALNEIGASQHLALQRGDNK